MKRLEKSALPRAIPIGGMMTPSTSDVIIFPKATPMITATARSITFPRAMNSLNSLHMVVFSCCWSVTVLRCFEAGFFCFRGGLESYLVGDLLCRQAAVWIVSFGLTVSDDLSRLGRFSRGGARLGKRVLLFFCLPTLGDQIICGSVHQPETWPTRNRRHG